MRKLMLLILIAVFAQGCRAPDPIPTYPNQSLHDSLSLMRQRSEQVKNISGQGDITLTDSAGKSVTLDGAFVFAPPDRARVRASKFGQAVLDLTTTGKGTWLFLARSDAHASAMQATSAEVGRAIGQWLSMLWGLDADAGEIEGSNLIITRTGDGGATFVYTVDRTTLTARKLQMIDANGATRMTLEMGDYRVVGLTVWPTTIRAKAQSGLVQIKLTDLETNSARDTAFNPPARAERVP